MIRIFEDFLYDLKVHRAKRVMPGIARAHNQHLLSIYRKLQARCYGDCISCALEWIESLPKASDSGLQLPDLDQISESELFALFSNRYKQTGHISDGEKQTILRRSRYPHVTSSFNGSGPTFLIIAVCYARLADHESALCWKDHAGGIASYFDSGAEFQRAIGIALALSQIGHLYALGRISEAEYLKEEFSRTGRCSQKYIL